MGIPSTTEWYAISLAIVVIVLVIARNSRLLIAIVLGIFSICHFIYLQLRPKSFRHLKHPTYQLALNRRYWGSVTWLQVIVIALYVLVNAVLMSLDFESFGWVTKQDAVIRTGTLATINMMPLFLGGRTNVLADRLGAALHVYYLAHHWIGRMVVLQGLIHTFLAISTSGEAIYSNSGILLVSILGGMFISSVYPIRRCAFELFLKFHFILAMAAISALFWHVYGRGFKRMVFPIVAVITWVINASIRFLRIIYFNTGELPPKKANIEVVLRASKEVDVIKIELQLQRPRLIKPGQYVYLRIGELQFLDKFQAHPFLIGWWNDAAQKNEVPLSGPSLAHSLTFFVQPKAGLTKRLTDKNNKARTILCDGPYGQTLHPERYKNVLLIAKGVGIIGILSYAKQLMSQMSNSTRRDQVITENLDIYWKADSNSQEKWTRTYLEELREQDKMLGKIQIWCYFPSPKPAEATFPFYPDQTIKNQYLYIYEDDENSKNIFEALKSAAIKYGRCIVITCGVPKFTTRVRALAADISTKDTIIEVAETEFRPLESKFEVELVPEKSISISSPIMRSEEI